MRTGDGVALWLLWLWMTIAVGPWWVGVAIIAIGFVLNGLQSRPPDDVIRR